VSTGITFRASIERLSRRIGARGFELAIPPGEDRSFQPG